MRAVSAVTRHQIATLRAAAWRMLGTARDLPAEVEALAQALHAQECGCDEAPDDDLLIRASGLIQAGWRHSDDALLRLSELLAEIAKAWDATSQQPISSGEQQRWGFVCALAEEIAREVTS